MRKRARCKGPDLVRRRLGWVAAVMAAGLLLAACSDSPEEPASQPVGEQGFVAGDGSLVVLPEADRQPAPEVAGPTLDGGELSLAQFKGRVVVLNVWASWCAPCRKESPDLQQVWEETRDEGSQFLGIDTRDSDAAANAFVANYGLTYPHLIDTDGRKQLGFSDTLPPQSIPSTLVIDRSGRVAARALGVVTAANLRGLLEPLLAEPALGEVPPAVVVDPGNPPA